SYTNWLSATRWTSFRSATSSSVLRRSGAYQSSASSTASQRPAAWLIPVFIACGLPWLRASWITRTRGSVANTRPASAVPSVDPSSTMSISRRRRSCCSTDRTARGSVVALLNAGMITETAHDADDIRHDLHNLWESLPVPSDHGVGAEAVVQATPVPRDGRRLGDRRRLGPSSTGVARH